jgi:hypothetical protein
MLEVSKELYNTVGNGKKNLRKEESKEKKPVWRSTGVSNMPIWERPTKYALNSNIKAKVYTGLPIHPDLKKIKESEK